LSCAEVDRLKSPGPTEARYRGDSFTPECPSRLNPYRRGSAPATFGKARHLRLGIRL